MTLQKIVSGALPLNCQMDPGLRKPNLPSRTLCSKINLLLRRDVSDGLEGRNLLGPEGFQTCCPEGKMGRGWESVRKRFTKLKKKEVDEGSKEKKRSEEKGEGLVEEAGHEEILK